MAPQTGTALLVLAAFVLPGFVTVLLRERTYHVRAGVDTLELLLTALLYSGLIYLGAACAALLAGVSTADVAALTRGQASLATYALLAFAGLILGPALITFTGTRWLDSRVRVAFHRRLRIDPTHATRSGWGRAFSHRGPRLMLITLDDGRLVGGLFGTDSIVGHARNGDVFLQERWVVGEDAWFTGERAPETQGMYVAGEKIVSIEVYDLPRNG
ncbi:MAG TPA: DUF6338 family protein [Solirubrobacteraceae bacterium]|nr:DUF6338 family protein [Solirubrobacteraceae bacterium]